jgi:hypothetical protein
MGLCGGCDPTGPEGAARGEHDVLRCLWGMVGSGGGSERGAAARPSAASPSEPRRPSCRDGDPRLGRRSSGKPPTAMRPIHQGERCRLGRHRDRPTRDPPQRWELRAAVDHSAHGQEGAAKSRSEHPYHVSEAAPEVRGVRVPYSLPEGRNRCSARRHEADWRLSRSTASSRRRVNSNRRRSSSAGGAPGSTSRFSSSDKSVFSSRSRCRTSREKRSDA